MTTRMEPRIVEAPPSAAPTAPKTASATVDAPSTTASLRDAWKRKMPRHQWRMDRSVLYSGAMQQMQSMPLLVYVE